MSISGMTGFARAEGAHEGVRWSWEAKSVNGRGLDLKLRLPPGFDALEPAAREAAQKRFKRGSLQCGLQIAHEAGAQNSPRVDLAFIEQLIEAGRPLINAGKATPPRWDGLLALRGALIVDEGATESEAARASLEAALLAGFLVALDKLDAARREEGRMLAGLMSGFADRLEALIAEAKLTAALAPAAALDRIRQRLAALSPEVQFDPQRLAQEGALAALKADVQEEVERLVSHTRDLRALIAKPEAAGRKLDFLTQELTREANTLCSKSSEIDLTRVGLDLKAVIDQIKEQAANVE